MQVPVKSNRLLASGARAYLTKPLDVSKFIAVIDEILGEGEPDNAEATKAARILIVDGSGS